MSESWQEYDPITGLYEDYHLDDNGRFTIKTWQDVEPYLDYAKAVANEGLADAGWKKNGFTNYAIIPPIVQAQMFKRGINFMDPNQTKRVVQEINKNYPYLKTTYKHHDLPR